MSQYHFEFLIELLQALADNRGNREVVYRLLENNLDKLDGVLVEVLCQRMTSVLRQVEANHAKFIALRIIDFSILIQEFPLDNRASKMEIVITGYTTALTVLTHEASPENWAIIQNNLGHAYENRINGTRADNLDEAIACYKRALIVLTHEASPKRWAMIHNKLGHAYQNRINGMRADNLEEAIACYKRALTVRTFDACPKSWANIQNSLGVAYKNRINGTRADNLEEAIACYERALRVFTHEASPKDWAMTQHNLGVAYVERINGMRADNLEEAIAYYKHALTIRTFDDCPKDWAITQNNLGDCYRERIRGEKAENLKTAIDCHLNALEVFENNSKEWAMAKNNLGLAYTYYSRGDKVKNLENAIEHFSDALNVCSYTRFRFEWAYMRGNLGTSYLHRIEGQQEENLKQAIQCFSDALKVYKRRTYPDHWAKHRNNLGMAFRQLLTLKQTKNFKPSIFCYLCVLQVHNREQFPEYWAMAKQNLGVAYFYQYQVSKEINDLKSAIECYSSSSDIFDISSYPQRYAENQDNLGMAYKENQQLNESYKAFANAIDAIENLREEILYGSAIENDKKELAEKWNQTYQSIVKVCVDLAQDDAQYYSKAIEYVERSKTRNLVELILDRHLKTIFPLEVANRLEQLRDEIACGQYKIQNHTAENPRLLAQSLEQLRQQRQKLQDTHLSVGSGFKFDQFQPTLDQRTAIVEWYITDKKILAFVIEPKWPKLTVWQSRPEDREALLSWVNEYLQDYSKTGKNQWRDKLDERLKKLSEILHLESILDQILKKQYDRLILIPHRFLHLLPIHALPVGESYLLDRFSQGVGYAPSCQLLQQVQKRQRPDFQSLFTVQNPTGDLQFTDLEVNSILSLFPFHQVLSNNHATKAALDRDAPHLQEVNYLHFSCHGSFNPDSPFLLLADAEVSSIPTDADPKQYLETSKGFIDLSKCLTLSNLFERGFDLNKCRLVVLSACETGWIDFNNNSDEYIGLPSGFLYAGSASVVSSLWTVDDMSTAYLMIKFIQNLKAAFDGGENVSVTLALKQAQNWLRNITREDLNKWADGLQLDPKIKGEIVRSNREIVAKSNLDNKIDDKPFQSPYYWAGFTAIGK